MKSKKSAFWGETEPSFMTLNGDYDEPFAKRFVNEYGKPVARTPITHPYGYDRYVIYRGGQNSEINGGGTYSDRIWQADSKRHDELCMQIWGNRKQLWDDRQPKQVEEFLRLWTGNPKLRLILYMVECNRSNGFPIWSFEYAKE